MTEAFAARGVDDPVEPCPLERLPLLVLTLPRLIDAGASFRFGFSAGMNALLGGMVGEFAIVKILGVAFKDIPRGIAALFGTTLGPWGELITDVLVVGGWIVANTVPVHAGKTAAEYAQWYFTNAFDNMSDGGERLGASVCPVGNVPSDGMEVRLCTACQEALRPIATNRPARPGRSEEVPYDWDVTPFAHYALREFQPIEFQAPDDLFPVTLDRLLGVGTLHDASGAEVSPSPRDAATYADWLRRLSGTTGKDFDTWLQGGEEAHLEWDDEIGQRLGRDEAPGTVYGRVLWAESQPDRLYLQYVHLRGGSWLPTRHLYPFSWEHVGDGEMAMVVVQYDKDTGTCRLLGTLTGGHRKTRDCGNVAPGRSDGPAPRPPVEVHPDATGKLRPAIYIGYGSHAIAPAAGKRAAGWGTTDWCFAPPQAVGVLPTLIHDPQTPPLREYLFTSKVKWGGYEGYFAVPLCNPSEHDTPPGCTCGSSTP